MTFAFMGPDLVCWKLRLAAMFVWLVIQLRSRFIEKSFGIKAQFTLGQSLGESAKIRAISSPALPVAVNPKVAAHYFIDSFSLPKKVLELEVAEAGIL